MSRRIVRYVAGAKIDPSSPLEIERLHAANWRLVEKVYPEIEAAPSSAAFRTARNTTILPIKEVTQRALKKIREIVIGNQEFYELWQSGRLVGLLVVVQAHGSYTSLHVYRLKA